MSFGSRKHSPYHPSQQVFSVVFPDGADDPSPAESDGQPSAEMRFLEYLEECALAQLARENASPLTIEDYRRIGELFAAVNANPRLCDIAAAAFRRFRDAIAALPKRRPRHAPGESYVDYVRQLTDPTPRDGESPEAFAKRRDWTLSQPRISQNTQHKMGVTINALLSMAGPSPADDDDHYFGLLKRAPRMTPPREQLDDNINVVSAAEYQALLGAAERIDVPTKSYTGYPPALFWAGLLPFLRGTGTRIGMPMRAEWSWLNGNVLAAPTNAMKRGRARPFYLTRSVLAAIEPLKPFGRQRIFGWPKEWPAGDTWLGRCWRRLCTEAGLPPTRRLTRHDLRRTHGTMLFMRDPAAAQKSLGHTRLITTLTHYVADPDTAALLEELF